MNKIQERIHFIQKMEHYADTLQMYVDTKDYVSLLTNENLYKDLKNYYESKAWIDDFKMDEQQFFPADLKRGILSEDYVYNLLSDIEQMKSNIEHEYVYKCGVIDAFNEVIKAGVKDLALSHPSSFKEIETLLPFADAICKKYGTHYEVEPDLLITDLFPYSANKGKTVILFYKKPEIIQKYHDLKKQKEIAIQNNTYDTCREKIAYAFGKLLSYSDDSIYAYISTNTEKE